MPLAWAHAEFIKLMVSRHLAIRSTGRRRYGGATAAAAPSRETRGMVLARAHAASRPPGMTLIVALPRAAQIHWGVNGWQDLADLRRRIPVSACTALNISTAGRKQVYRFYDSMARHAGLGQHKDFHIAIDSGN